MAEEASTGGLMKFRYEKGQVHKLDEERKRDIRGAYEQYYERKARENRHRRWFWILGFILLVLIVFGFSRMF